MNRLTALLALSPALLAPAPLFAEDELDMGHIVVVEQRPHRLVHEFRGSLGILPVDTFATAITLGASYTLHSSDVWAWEVIDFVYAVGIDTGVEELLAERWTIAPAVARAELQLMLGTRVLFTPLYGKLAFLNDEIIYADAHFSAGGGLAHYSDGFRPQLNAGPGLRFFASSVVSARVDLRAGVIPGAPGGTDFLAGIEISFAANFGRTRVTDPKDAPPAKARVDGLELLDELYPRKGDAAKGNEP